VVARVEMIFTVREGVVGIIDAVKVPAAAKWRVGYKIQAIPLAGLKMLGPVHSRLCPQLNGSEVQVVFLECDPLLLKTTDCCSLPERLASAKAGRINLMMESWRLKH
jgi:hypothetical protein